MIVSIHVYDDGDVELTRLVRKPKFPDGNDIVIVDDEARLKAELLDYGQSEDRIDEALLRLKTEELVTV
jgi:hypothetical protein